MAQHQHYVPRMLLKGFLSCDPKEASKEQVRVFDLVEQKGFTTSISNIMGETRFNEWWLDDEHVATIEPAATEIESRLSPLIRRIRAERKLERTPEEFADLAFLMAFQFIRTKRMRLLPERLNAQVRAKVVRMGLDPQKVEGLQNWDEDTLKQQHVRHQIKSVGEYAQIIAQKEFFLMTAPHGSTLYLGDHPVVMHNDEKRHGPFGNLGLGVPYIQIYLPLAGNVLLCAYDRAVLGQLMMNRADGLREIQSNALDRLRCGLITAQQMKAFLHTAESLDITTPLVDAIRAGDAIPMTEQNVQHYNSLQAFQAHRFLIDPNGDFEVARQMCGERVRAYNQENL